jgi:hypothetical protein
MPSTLKGRGIRSPAQANHRRKKKQMNTEVQNKTTAPLSEKEQRKQMRRDQKARQQEIRSITCAIYTLSQIDKFDDYSPPVIPFSEIPSEIASYWRAPEQAYMSMEDRITDADDALRNLQAIMTELHRQIDKERQS